MCTRIEKLSLEREVDQMVNDMMQKEGWTRSHALSVLRSRFESEERHQEVEYVNDLIQKEAEEQESELPPTATTTVAEEEINSYSRRSFFFILNDKRITCCSPRIVGLTQTIKVYLYFFWGKGEMISLSV
jgi:hypothetical protein